jgi:hypothetical protein
MRDTLGGLRTEEPETAAGDKRSDMKEATHVVDK